MKKKDKKFDCVEMQHRGGEEIRKKTEGMTLEEQLEYWRKRDEDLKEWQARLKATRR